MSDNPYKEYEDVLEAKIKSLSLRLSFADEEKFNYHDVRRELSDLKHMLWQSRL